MSHGFRLLMTYDKVNTTWAVHNINRHFTGHCENGPYCLNDIVYLKVDRSLCTHTIGIILTY